MDSFDDLARIPEPGNEAPAIHMDGAAIGEVGSTVHVEAARAMPRKQDTQRQAGFQPRQGVVYAAPGTVKACTDPYDLPMGSERAIPEEDLAVLSSFLRSHPQVEETYSRDTLLRILAYQPVNDASAVSALQLIHFLLTSPPNLRAGHVDALLRIIDTAPDELIRNKPSHLAFALQSFVVMRIWLAWKTHASAVRDWPGFAGVDPYRAAAGMLWRKKAHQSVRSIEGTALAFADWWVVTNVDPVIGQSPASDDGVRALIRVGETMVGVVSPSQLAAALAALPDSMDVPRSARDVKRFWDILNIDPDDIFRAPDRWADQGLRPNNASKEEAC